MVKVIYPMACNPRDHRKMLANDGFWRFFVSGLSAGRDDLYDAGAIMRLTADVRGDRCQAYNARLRPTSPESVSLMTAPQSSENYKALKRRREDVWRALSTYVTSLNGFVVSVPYRRTARIECPLDSVLPDKLAQLGYRVRHHGQITRTGPNGFTPAKVFEVDLPI